MKTARNNTAPTYELQRFNACCTELKKRPYLQNNAVYICEIFFDVIMYLERNNL